MADQPATIGLPEAPSEIEEERILEAILFAAAEPVTLAELRDRIPHDFDIRAALQRLVRLYADRGFRVVKTGDGWAVRTAPEFSFLLRKHRRSTRKLSRAALETLAIVAYHQPVTRAEIEEIRGVSLSRGTVDQLMQVGWVSFGQRKRTPGRPVTFVITRQFLDHFQLTSVGDLPGLRELRQSGLLAAAPPSDSEA